MPELTAPARFPSAPIGPSIFLAGSIEQGGAIDWQRAAIQRLLDARADLTVFNPRRDAWDPTWDQHPDNPQFLEQVTWELDHLEAADQVLFVFDPATRSPITLMELGLMLPQRPGRVVIACPPGYWRRGNVLITASRFNAPVHDLMDDAIADALQRLPL